MLVAKQHFSIVRINHSLPPAEFKIVKFNNKPRNTHKKWASYEKAVIKKLNRSKLMCSLIFNG